MERYLGLDVHAQSCTLAVISAAGKKLKDVVIETNGQALIEAIRTIPGRKHLCLCRCDCGRPRRDGGW